MLKETYSQTKMTDPLFISDEFKLSLDQNQQFMIQESQIWRL